MVTKAADLKVEFLDRLQAADASSGVRTSLRSSAVARLVHRPKATTRGLRGLVAMVSAICAACEPGLDVGEWKCTAAPLFVPPDGSLELPGRETIVNPEWQTGFEDGFCGYAKARGFCYSDPDASYRIVDAPARSGRKAAAFTINTEEGTRGEQTRCVREGTLPQDAYYGAWFYIPGGTTNNGNWNLMHFRSAVDDGPLDGDWDVSLVSTDDGRLVPLLRDYVGESMIPPSMDFEVPVDRWFSLSLRLVRESTPTGTAALFLDGELVVELTDVVTDPGAIWGQWYVGNLATDLTPSDSTIYIDDVSIRENLDVPL